MIRHQNERNSYSNGDKSAGDYDSKDEQMCHKLETWRLYSSNKCKTHISPTGRQPQSLLMLPKKNYKWQCNDALCSLGPII
jgi:hypothetical protein